MTGMEAEKAIKQATGNTVEKAGLIGGKLFGIAAAFGDDVISTPAPTTFSLVAQGTAGDVSDLTGAQLQAASANLTQFGRPEDGAWDPSKPNRFYFITTGATVNGARFPFACGPWILSTSNILSLAARCGWWSKACSRIPTPTARCLS